MKRKSNMPKHKLELAPGATSNTDQHHQDLAHQPPTKRLRVPLNFSIESIMQPASQQQQALSAYQFLGSPDLIGGSPLGLSAAATSYHQNRQNNNNNNNNNNSNSNNHHHQQHLNHQQQAKSSLVGLNVSRSPSPASHSDSSSSRSGTSSHTKRRYQSRDIKPPAHNHMTLNERESLASPLSSSPSTSALSSRNSSRVSSPISPGCHQEGNSNLSLNTLNHHHHHQQQQQHHHHHHHRAHLNSNQNQKHRPLSSQSPSFTNMNQHQTSSRHHHQAGASSSSAPNATTSNPGSTGHLNQVECVLDNKDMWDKFHSLNTEMIITKTGRRMFPVLKVQFHNLDPTARYAVSMDIVPVDNKRYRYAYHKSCWQVAGKADPSAEPRLYPHPDSPFNGDLLSRQVISFEKVKLTNNEMDKSGHIILNSMHKYQPRVHLIELKSTLPPQQSPLQQLPSLNGTHSTSKMSSPGGGPSRFNQQQTQQQQQQQQKPQPQLDIEGYRTFVFPETVFTAVTAYQNQLITKMKIDKNPFAKGFRDSSRLNDLDRNDPFDYMSSLGPAAAAAAAAACAAGRFPGGPSGGPSGLPLGSLEAAAAAAGLPPPPGSHQGQMDQAYSQLLVSAATANSPWYSAAAANPFGGMGAACSTAQAAQLQATQLWLAAAFSSAFQNGGSGQPQSLPPPNNSNGPALLAPPGGPTPSHTDSPLGSTPGALHQECRGDSRSSG